jgi:nitronate monooxygenase
MIETSLTEMFGLSHPIVLGPMGSVAGGLLAAEVSNAGGLGLVGGGYGDRDWLKRELHRVKDATSKPWGVGLITWSSDRSLVDWVLAHEPHAFMLSFGDPRPHAAIIKAAGCKLICQVQDLAGAELAREAGADLIVAQGTEAGGHGGRRATLPFVPAVVDAVSPIPVLAAGGIADGRGLAAALMLGAQGALIGTRFQASQEALCSPAAKEAITRARGDETGRTRIFDIVRSYRWPREYTGRALRNRFFERWHEKEFALELTMGIESRLYREATRNDDLRTAVVWAGEVVDLVDRIGRAADIVREIGTEAEALLHRGTALSLRRPPPSPQG